jgi:hypothetical protein
MEGKAEKGRDLSREKEGVCLSASMCTIKWCVVECVCVCVCLYKEDGVCVLVKIRRRGVCACERVCTVCFRDLAKLNLLMVVRF